MSTDFKSELRKELITLRNGLSVPTLSYDILASVKEFNEAKTVFCYISFGSEVITRELLWEIAKNKTLTVPCCIDACGNMICVKIETAQDLKPGRFGIPEPKIPLSFEKKRIDFAVVPGVAFSPEGYRLGYGKGYYDRFLADIAPYKLGVCKKELIRKLPVYIHDIKMDSVLSL